MNKLYSFILIFLILIIKAQTFTISVRNLNKGGVDDKIKFSCGSGQTILDAAISSGINLPYAGKNGSDPASVGFLISGTVDQSDQSFLSENEIKERNILYDVAYPVSNCDIFILWGRVAGAQDTENIRGKINNEENYIYSKTCLDSVCARKSETVEYLDGLGRPKQVVRVRATPKGNDIATPVEYDGFGRQVRDYLPVPQAGTQNGTIYADPASNSSATYGNEKIYSESILENSPLDRVLRRVQPGNDWAAHPARFDYDANADGEVLKFVTSTSWTAGATVSSVALGPASDAGAANGHYGAAQLYKDTVTDEDGNSTIEFRDGQGHSVLVRRSDGVQNIDTYYVYNEYDQLAFVIPPKAAAGYRGAAAGTAVSQDDLDGLCYQYRYDGRNRLVEKKIPGKGWEYMVYDRQDRPVLTQDANLRGNTNNFKKQGWLFTKYDMLGRVVYSGFYADTGSRAAAQAAVDTAANAANNESRSGMPFTLNGMDVYYGGGAYPSSPTVLLSVNYYDSYPPGSPARPQSVLGQPTLGDDATAGPSTAGMPTASYIKDIEDDAWTKNYTWYDGKGRAVGTHSVNHLGGYTKTETKLDFVGNPLRVETRHKRLDADGEVAVYETFAYDAQNRLLSHTHQVDGGPVETLMQNSYDELSRISSKTVGSGLQQTDYSYNIRGWLTGINDPKNLKGRLFGMSIGYQSSLDITNTTPYLQNPALSVKPRFDGNIAQVSWADGDASNPELQTYGYVYDGIGRLSAGFYYSGPQYLYNGENMELPTYDQNGNIVTLKRTAKRIGAIPELIDNLVYAYKGNMLQSVNDLSGNISGNQGQGQKIDYDSNGNMKSLPGKDINTINYNFLNLPNLIDTGYGLINTHYRGDGVKIYNKFEILFGGRAILFNNEYLDNFTYKTDSNPAALIYFPTTEGFYDYQKKQYIYQYRDHLGNVRISYTRNQAGGTDVLDTNDYYPFGMKFGHSDFQPGDWKNYKYNGKELQETGMYDYGARMYMPDIGRWGVVDAKAEESVDWTPYRYAFNNPLIYTDPNGEFETRIDAWLHKIFHGHWDSQIQQNTNKDSKAYGQYYYTYGQGKNTNETNKIHNQNVNGETVGNITQLNLGTVVYANPSKNDIQQAEVARKGAEIADNGAVIGDIYALTSGPLSPGVETASTILSATGYALNTYADWKQGHYSTAIARTIIFGVSFGISSKIESWYEAGKITTATARVLKAHKLIYGKIYDKGIENYDDKTYKKLKPEDQ